MKTNLFRSMLLLLASLLLQISTRAEYEWKTFVGKAGEEGYADGKGAEARFGAPVGLVLDTAGNLYVSDMVNKNLRKVTPEGEVSTLAGPTHRVKRGSGKVAPGSGGKIAFRCPIDVAVDEQKNLFVADYIDHTIRKVTPEGVVSLWVGDPKLDQSVDGVRAKARFCLLETLMLTPEGNFYVSDNGVLRKVAPAGDVFRLAGGVYSGSLPLKGSATTKPQIKALAKEEQWAANDTLDRVSAKGICMDAKGNLYVADIGRSVILKLGSEGKVSVIAGKENDPGHDDGPLGTSRFMSPTRPAIDAAGNLYVTDMSAHTIRKVDSDGLVTTIGGSPGKTGNAEGVGNAARFSQPIGIAVSSKGILYVADGSSNRIVIGTPIGK